MNNVDEQYELFKLSEEERLRLNNLTSLSEIYPGGDLNSLIIVETVIIQGGERVVVKREEINAKLV